MMRIITDETNRAYGVSAASFARVVHGSCRRAPSAVDPSHPGHPDHGSSFPPFLRPVGHVR